jgi:hypothetical protein
MRNLPRITPYKSENKTLSWGVGSRRRAVGNGKQPVSRVQVDPVCRSAVTKLPRCLQATWRSPDHLLELQRRRADPGRIPTEVAPGSQRAMVIQYYAMLTVQLFCGW